MFGAGPNDIYSDAGPGSSLDLDTDRPMFSDDTYHPDTQGTVKFCTQILQQFYTHCFILYCFENNNDEIKLSKILKTVGTQIYITRELS